MATAEISLQAAPEADEELCSRAMQLASGAVFPMVLKAAVEVGLIDVLLEAGTAAALTAEEIAARLPARNPQAATAALVDRILCLLAANDIVAVCAGAAAEGCSLRRYRSAPICRYFAKNRKDSIAHLLLLQQDKIFMDIWHYFKDSILEGGNPVEAAYETTAFEYELKDPRFKKVFNDAMRGHTAVFVDRLLCVYGGFDGVEVLVDVGGGDGTALGMITSRHPNIKGINFDLPHVIAAALPPRPGIEHISGDMFDCVPNGDAILLKCILHDWSDEHGAKLLRNCRKALPEKGGKVVVMDYVVPVVPESSVKAQGMIQMDLLMSAVNIGGRERREEELRALARGAGFTGFKALPVYAGYWVIELTK